MTETRAALPNGETVSLRELYAKLEGYVARMEERDKRYAAERDGDQRALAAAFVSSEKAIQKAEAAQNAYNDRSNEFRGQLDDQAKMLLPRAEYESKHKDLLARLDRIDVDIRGLRDSRSEITGRSSQTDAGRNQGNVLWGFALTGLSLVLVAGGALISLILALKK